MNVKQIVEKYLKDNNIDGLAGCWEWEGCGCGIDDLMPCDTPHPDCAIAKFVKCAGCKNKEGCEYQNDRGTGCYMEIKDNQ